MHDIKYFFLNKNNQTIQGETNFFSEGSKLLKQLSKNTIFQNPDRSAPEREGHGVGTDMVLAT
jgi:hypothetical protein